MPSSKKGKTKKAKKAEAAAAFDSESETEELAKAKPKVSKIKKERPILPLNAVSFSDLDGMPKGDFEYTKTAAMGKRKGPILAEGTVVAHLHPINALKQIFLRHPALVDRVREREEFKSEMPIEETHIEKDGITLSRYPRAFKECNVAAQGKKPARETILADVIPSIVLPKQLEETINSLIKEFTLQCENEAIKNDSELATQHPDVYLHAFRRCMDIYRSSLPKHERTSLDESLAKVYGAMDALGDEFTKSFARAGIPVSRDGAFGIDPSRPSTDISGRRHNPIRKEYFDEFIARHGDVLTKIHDAPKPSMGLHHELSDDEKKTLLAIGHSLTHEGVTPSSEGEDSSPVLESARIKEHSKTHKKREGRDSDSI